MKTYRPSVVPREQDGVRAVTSLSAPPGGALPTLPPGPRGDLRLAEVRTDPLRFVTDLFEGYGDVTAHRVDGETVVMVNRPDLVKRVLKDNGANYTKKHTPDDHM